MKKTILSLVFISLFGLMSYAQGNLQFSQVKIVSNVQETVPAGKVWKVTSIYGNEFRANECINTSLTSTHELRHLRCAFPAGYWGINESNSTRGYYRISMFYINNTPIISSVSGLSEESRSYTIFNSTNCTGSQTTNSEIRSCANISTDPNILPIWLPSASIIKSAGPNTFVSVIEFNIIP